MSTQHPYNNSKLKEFRRQLRTNGTSAEAMLWKMIKAKQIDGLGFRRQFSIGDFILDFYCPSLRLAIELDGDVHYNAVKSELDLSRDEKLKDVYQIHTLRYENNVVFEHPETIINSIKEYASNRRIRY